jgi:hypothetical protein
VIGGGAKIPTPVLLLKLPKAASSCLLAIYCNWPGASVITTQPSSREASTPTLHQLRVLLPSRMPFPWFYTNTSTQPLCVARCILDYKPTVTPASWQAFGVTDSLQWITKIADAGAEGASEEWIRWLY